MGKNNLYCFKVYKHGITLFISLCFVLFYLKYIKKNILKKPLDIIAIFVGIPFIDTVLDIINSITSFNKIYI